MNVSIFSLDSCCERRLGEITEEENSPVSPKKAENLECDCLDGQDSEDVDGQDTEDFDGKDTEDLDGKDVGRFAPTNDASSIVGRKPAKGVRHDSNTSSRSKLEKNQANMKISMQSRELMDLNYVKKQVR